MGTHPIFESDFDCLTDVLIENYFENIYVLGKFRFQSFLLINGQDVIE